MALGPGTRLGAYDILTLLGSGGMGEVYRAKDTKLGRDVALKILPATFTNDPDRLARFRREAQVLAALNHPHIGAIYGLDDANGIQFLVLELVDGESLADLLERGAIPVDEALAMARQIAEALEAAHEKGIIHRDLKPANIAVARDGNVKVLDFGLAKATDAANSGSVDQMNSPTITSPAMMTGVGMILGTAAYMSPEQAKGRSADKRSDIWAFGAVLYEMLTNRRAFPGDDISETLAAVIKSEPDWAALPSDTPPAIHRLARRCLEKNPRQRVPDIAVARIEIDEALAAPPNSEAAVAIGDTRRWRRAFTSLTIAILSAAGASVVTWAVTRTTARSATPSTRFAINLPSTQAVAISLNDRDLALSPEGTHLVYTAGGERQLMLRPLDHLDSVALAGGSNARAPFFSPDGRWVGFFDRLDEGITTGAAREGYLKKVSTAGGAPVVICRVLGGSRGASWGSSETIVFATNDTKSGLMSVSASGGEPTVLTVPDRAKGERDHQFPSVLPQGRGVLFTIVADRPEDAQVAVLDLKTRQHKILVRRGSHAEYVDTGHIVYIVEDTLWAARFDLPNLEVVGDPVPVVERVMAQNGANFTLSRNGTLAYVPRSGGAARTLVWVDRNGREEPIHAPTREYGGARLSPDGNRVAVTTRDETSNISTWDLAHQQSTRVEFESNSTNPVWSPDGRSIYFSTGPTDDRNLARHSADGTGTTERLTTNRRSNHRPTSITSDGRMLLFEEYASDTAYDLMVLPLGGGGQPRAILKTRFDERNGAISPDGRWLAYESNESGRDQIYVRPFPNVEDGRYQISTSGGRTPVWARNGRELFFVNGSTLLSAAVELTAPFRAGAVDALFDNPSLLFDTRFAGGSTVRSYDVSSDGRRFLAIKQGAGTDERTETTSMIVVLNWFEELKARVPTK